MTTLVALPRCVTENEVLNAFLKTEGIHQRPSVVENAPAMLLNKLSTAL
jgi:hypothetical protein